jgi:hypothetical protein
MSRETFRRIEWRVGNPDDEWSDVAIYIDGVSFIDLVARYEEGRGYLPAGSYGWCPAGRTMLPNRHFFGESIWPEAKGRVPLLFCECQCEGCWDFTARMVVMPEFVEWSEFQQIHRQAGSRGGHWDYSGFGPLRFERHQYELALVAARTAR